MVVQASHITSMQQPRILVCAGVRRAAGARGRADCQPRRHCAHDHGAVRPAQSWHFAPLHGSLWLCGRAHAHHGKKPRVLVIVPAACCRLASLTVLLPSLALIAEFDNGKCLSSCSFCLRRRQKQAGLLASATALREAADRRVAEAELGCERRLDDLEASLKARLVTCLLAALAEGEECSRCSYALQQSE